MLSHWLKAHNRIVRVFHSVAYTLDTLGFWKFIISLKVYSSLFPLHSLAIPQRKILTG